MHTQRVTSSPTRSKEPSRLIKSGKMGAASFLGKLFGAVLNVLSLVVFALLVLGLLNAFFFRTLKIDDGRSLTKVAGEEKKTEVFIQPQIICQTKSSFFSNTKTSKNCRLHPNTFANSHLQTWLSFSAPHLRRLQGLCSEQNGMEKCLMDHSTCFQDY